MDSNHKMLLALVMVLVALGVVYFLQKQGITVVPSDTQMTIRLTPTDAASGLFGSTAMFKQVDGKTVINLDLKNTPKGSIQPAHIHLGSCPTPGDIVYPLNPAENGKSETTLAVTLAQIKSQLPLALNVHKSPTELGIYTYCGNL